MEIVLYRNYGGFEMPIDVALEIGEDLPEFADPFHKEHTGQLCVNIYSNNAKIRSHPALIKWAQNEYNYAIVTIPDDVNIEDVVILDYDGLEIAVERGHFWPDRFRY